MAKLAALFGPKMSCPTGFGVPFAQAGPGNGQTLRRPNRPCSNIDGTQRRARQLNLEVQVAVELHALPVQYGTTSTAPVLVAVDTNE